MAFVCNGLIEQIRDSGPMIHLITNNVTMTNCANVLLAIGASPVCAEHRNEVEQVTAAADALVLNIGTFNDGRFESMLLSGKIAREMNKPVVFDPVGVGLSSLRKKAADKIISEVRPAVIRGNYSEIKALANITSNEKGVDSEEVTDKDEIFHIADRLSVDLNSVIAVTGDIDYVTYSNKGKRLLNRTEMLKKITGTGCMVSALCGAFVACSKDYHSAAIAAILTMTVCGEMAEMNSKGSFSFFTELMDNISNLSSKIIETKGVIE